MTRRVRGAALLLVMWLLVLLTGVVAVFALGARTEALQSRSLERSAIARYAAEAGLDVAMLRVLTACSLAALALHGGTVESGDADLLRTFWRPGEGPFRTWRVPGDWSIPARDDPVVNCNLVLALDLLGSPAAPAETAAVEALLGRSTSGSRYYCAPAAIAHAARRAGFAPGALPATAAARPTAGGVMAAAQWLAAGLGRDDRLVAGILAAQRPDGSWPGGAWVFGVGTPFWGSAAVTTAFAVEALADLVAATGAPPPWTAARAVAMKRRSRRDAGLAQG